MAESAIMMQWGMPFPGRETKALEEFTVNLNWWGQLQKDGKIESFSTYGMLSGNMQSFSGFAIVQGSEKQITELMATEDYRKRIVRVAALVDNFSTHHAETGDKMMTRMQRYGMGLKELGLT